MLSSPDRQLEAALADPNYEELVLLAAYYALLDAEPPSCRERMPVEYTNDLYELSKVVGKYRRSRFDNRRGNGLPRHRQIRVSRGRQGALA